MIIKTKQFATSQAESEANRKAVSAYNGPGQLFVNLRGVKVGYNKSDKKPSLSDIEKALKAGGVKWEIDTSTEQTVDGNERQNWDKFLKFDWKQNSSKQFASDAYGADDGESMTLGQFLDKELNSKAFENSKTIEGLAVKSSLKRKGTAYIDTDSEDHFFNDGFTTTIIKDEDSRTREDVEVGLVYWTPSAIDGVWIWDGKRYSMWSAED